MYLRLKGKHKVCFFFPDIQQFQVIFIISLQLKAKFNYPTYFFFTFITKRQYTLVCMWVCKSVWTQFGNRWLCGQTLVLLDALKTCPNSYSELSVRNRKTFPTLNLDTQLSQWLKLKMRWSPRAQCKIPKLFFPSESLPIYQSLYLPFGPNRTHRKTAG